MNNTDGRLWARWTLGISLLISVVGNVTHAVLATSDISLWLRVPGAVIWPVLAFLGIEIIVRVIWKRSTSHRFARLMVLWPIVPAAITSYEHLHALLLLMGERPFIAMIGPGAIDGAMVGCTLVLLFTRALPAEESKHPHFDALEKRWEEDFSSSVAPVSPAPLPTPVSAPPVSRAPRTWDGREVAHMILDGARTPEIVAATTAGRATVDRFRAALKILEADPRADVPQTRSFPSSAHVQMLRLLVVTR